MLVNRPKNRLLIQSIGTFIFVCLAPVVAFADGVSDQIRTIVTEFETTEVNGPTNTSLDSKVVLPALYEAREYQPAWSEDSADALIAELYKGVDQGFQPNDFHLGELPGLLEQAKSGGAQEKAIFDVVATDAAIKLVNYLVFGKVDPSSLDGDWNFSKPIIQQDPVQTLNTFIDGEGFPSLMSRIAIQNPIPKPNCGPRRIPGVRSGRRLGTSS